jgi:hypothetical protein
MNKIPIYKKSRRWLNTPSMLIPQNKFLFIYDSEGLIHAYVARVTKDECIEAAHAYCARHPLGFTLNYTDRSGNNFMRPLTFSIMNPPVEL